VSEICALPSVNLGCYSIGVKFRAYTASSVYSSMQVVIIAVVMLCFKMSLVVY